MPPLSLLIKPASSLCNLRCKYCFYHDIAAKREHASRGLMSLETLELLVKRAFAYTDSSITFAFQGGEPTLAGLEFYRQLMIFEKQYNTKKIPVFNSIQTNGIVIDEEWARFFAEHHFLVGISLDGPKSVHDSNRINEKEVGSFGQVMQAIEFLKRFQVEFNILTVVNAMTSRHIEQIYRFFRKEDFTYLQFIPCLDPLGEKQGMYPWSLSTERYGSFLIKLFDLWYEDVINGRLVSIRQFDNYVGMILGHPPESCGMSGICTCYFVIEADGNVYPCDFYVLDEWRLGNLKDDDFAHMLASQTAKQFVDVSKPISPECKECRYFKLCYGGCRRYREPFVEGVPSLNVHCKAYKVFFDATGDRLMQLARRFAANRR